jgi:ferric enterobactin receptor
VISPGHHVILIYSKIVSHFCTPTINDMKYFLPVITFLLSVTHVYAQNNSTGKGKIIGKVRDSRTNAAVDYATVAIYKEGSTSPINGTTTDTKGSFVLTNIPNGEYQVSVDFIGYQRVITQHLIISDAVKNINMNTILITSNQKVLSSVNVTAKANIIENKIDKMVYNVANDITAQGGVATDVLKKVPMVTVDIDGNVELLGDPSVKFLINGKPSSIFGASLNDALQSIPASQIKSIEVITSPGAKYDAKGTGGIINIILKDNKVAGYNGSINLSAGTRLENTSINLNARKEKFGASAFFSGNQTLRSKTLSMRNRSNLTQDVIQNQDGYGYLERGGFQTGVNFEFNPTKNDNFGAGLNYHRFHNYNEGVTNQEDRRGNGATLSDILTLRNSNSQQSSNAVDVHADYKHTFKKDGPELDVSYTSSFNQSNGDFYQKMDYTNTKTASTGSMGSNPGKDRETEIAIDYSLPLSDKVTLETGGKSYFETINSTSIVNALDTISKLFVFDPNQSSNFTYSRNVYSYYVSGTFGLFNFFDVKAGLRDEYTTTSVDFQGSIIPSYNFLSPSFTLSHKLTKTQTLKVAYSKRIERPDFGDLNPFINSSDPYNISYGNPNLHPEIGNNFELGYNNSFGEGGNVNITGFFRHNGFDVKQYTTRYDSLQVAGKYYKNVYVTTRANVGAEVRAGINISASIPITKNFSVRSNVMISNLRILVDIPNTPSFISGYQYRFNINASYQFKHDLIAEGFVNYESPRVNLQGTNTSFAAYNFAFRKQFLNKKASFGFTTSVPFSEYTKQSQTILTNGNNQYSARLVPLRSFGISLSYKFGKLEFKNDKNEENNVPQMPGDQQ